VIPHRSPASWTLKFFQRSDRAACGWLGNTRCGRENGRRFLTPLVFAGCLLTGLETACSGKSGGFQLRSAREKAASHPVSRQSTQTSGVKKRLPFLMGVVTPL